jgi:hypothetical protein
MSHHPRPIGLAVAIVFMAAACGDSAGPTVPTQSTVQSEAASSISPAVPPATASPAPGSALVGEWARETRCDEIVERLTEAGLEASVLDSAAAFVPGASTGADIKNRAAPCDGAIPVRHSHFFTADGLFGSRDQDGNRVDDGRYRLTDDATFVVSKEFPDVTFHFSVDGDTIMFEPVMPACAPDCFEATWAVSVAFEGLPWTRVPGS